MCICIRCLDTVAVDGDLMMIMFMAKNLKGKCPMMALAKNPCAPLLTLVGCASSCAADLAADFGIIHWFGFCRRRC